MQYGGGRGGGKQYGGVYHQYSGKYSACMCHTISTEEAHRQYGGECAVRTCHPISTDVSHLQYGGGYAVWPHHIINTVEGVQYGQSHHQYR